MVSTALYLFWYFAFLKIYSAFVFVEPISLVACAIFAITLTVLEVGQAVLFNDALSSTRNLYIAIRQPDWTRQQLAELEQRRENSIHKLWAAYVATVVLGIVALVLISKGFSTQFFDRELAARYARDSLFGLQQGTVWVLAAGLIIMTLPHMIMVQLGLNAVRRGEF